MSRRLILAFFLGLLLLSALIPPWRGTFHHNGQKVDVGFRKFAPIWQPAVDGVMVQDIDYKRLLMEWILLVLFAAGLVFMFKKDPTKD